MSDIPREPDPSLGGNPVDQGARTEDIAIQTEDDVIETLRAQLEDLRGSVAEKDKAVEEERRRAAEADRQRRDAEARAQQAATEARQTQHVSERATATAQLDAVKNALESQQSSLTGLKAAYAAAMAEGDFAKGADIQAEMATTGARIVQLELGRDELDKRIKTAPEETPQAPQSDYERKEAYIRTMPSKVQDWLRGANGERYFNDRGFQQKVAAAASYAQNVKSIDPNSDRYIEFIETEVGLRQAAAESPTAAQPGGAPARGRDPDDARRMTAAPAGGSTAGSVRSNADGSTSVYLTPDEKDMARRMGVSESDWAREKAAAIRANQIGPNARR